MSPTLLEFVIVLVILVVAWQIGVAIAPDVFRWIASLRDDVDTAANDALEKLPPTQTTSSTSSKEEHRNGTHR